MRPRKNSDPAPLPNINELLQQLSAVRLRDRFFLKKELNRIAEQLKKQQDCSFALAKFSEKVRIAESRSLIKAAASCKISYPEELPVSLRRTDILAAIKQNQVVIICGSTGSGKTTQLPKMLLEAGGGRFGAIGCTQPRRLAATAMARRVAGELETELGNQVGYKVRFDDKTGPNTVIKFLTDGMLLSEIASDAKLLNYDAIIIDEVHERSLNIDFLLGYLKNLLPQRPDLKVIISSATLDAEHFAEFFYHAPIITVEGRTFPVEDFYLPAADEDEELSTHIARAVEFIDELDSAGDILIFLPGEREIRDATDVLTGRRYRNTEVLPLFARLSMGEQQRIFAPGRQRRIILATNVAETSVTIPRIHYVIDSGLARISRYNAKSGIQELQIEQISQASARQRRGRCGRIADGICVYLYDEDTMKQAAEYTDPEIKRTSLAGVILQMAMLKLGNIEHFPFIDPPPGNLIREGRRTLSDIEAIDEHHHITAQGRSIAAMPIDPHLARMLLYGKKLGVGFEMTVVTANLSIPDPKERPQEKQQAADTAHTQWRDKESDFVSIINLWNFLQLNAKSKSDLRKLARRNFLNFNRLVEWKNLLDDLLSAGKEGNNIIPVPENMVIKEFSHDALHQAVLAGVPRNLGMYDAEKANYLGTAARRFLLFPGSGLAKLKPIPKWILTLNLVETSRVFARQNAVIKPEFLELVAPHLCTATYDQVEFNASSGFVYARERLVSGGLPIHMGRRVHYGKLRPAEARKVFIREALAEGKIESKHPLIKAYLQELNALKLLEDKLRRPGTVVDSEAIYEALLLKLPNSVVSTQSLEAELNKQKLLPLPREEMMMYQFTPVNFADYPDSLNIAGEKFALQYTFDCDSEADGIAVLVPKNDLNLISPAQLEYLVPGYLSEKVELMLRKLPKQKRLQIRPINDTIELYVDEVRRGKIPTDLPLAETLADFLTATFDDSFNPADFDHVEFPEFLIMKIAELDAHGQITSYHQSLPDNPDAGSRVSSRLARHYAMDAGAIWPGGEMPEAMPLPDNTDITAYPALFSTANGVGRQLYLREDEAKMRHSIGIIQLFRLQHAEQIKFIMKHTRFTNQVRLTLFYHDLDKEYVADFADLAIERSLGGNLWQIRSPQKFAQCSEQAVADLAENAANLLLELEKIAESVDKLGDLLHKFSKRSTDGIADLKMQLSYLLRPGFLRIGVAVSNYPRYLRGMQLRIERLNSFPAKDEAKLEQISALIERFRVAANSIDDLDRHPQLQEFFLQLEELRLTLFAPEIRTYRKVSIKSVENFWTEIRI